MSSSASEGNSVDSKYLLTANEAERQRLQGQHELMKRTIRKDLLPLSWKVLPGHRILDSGTGSGAWPVDVVSLVSTDVSIYASDITSRLFPPDPPKNITFSTHSVLSLPSAWTSTFDFVHQRLLVAALGLGDWQRALSELYRVLKPGGQLFLEESSGGPVLPAGVDISDKIPYTYKVRRIVERLWSGRDLLLKCGTELPGLMMAAGFEVLTRETQGLAFGPADIGEEYRGGWSVAYRLLGDHIVADGLIGSKDEWEQLVGHAVAEWAGGNHVFFETYAFTARKPLAHV